MSETQDNFNEFMGNSVAGKRKAILDDLILNYSSSAAGFRNKDEISKSSKASPPHISQFIEGLKSFGIIENLPTHSEKGRIRERDLSKYRLKNDIKTFVLLANYYFSSTDTNSRILFLSTQYSINFLKDEYNISFLVLNQWMSKWGIPNKNEMVNLMKRPEFIEGGLDSLIASILEINPRLNNKTQKEAFASMKAMIYNDPERVDSLFTSLFDSFSVEKNGIVFDHIFDEHKRKLVEFAAIIFAGNYSEWKRKIRVMSISPSSFQLIVMGYGPVRPIVNPPVVIKEISVKSDMENYFDGFNMPDWLKTIHLNMVNWLDVYLYYCINYDIISGAISGNIQSSVTRGILTDYLKMFDGSKNILDPSKPQSETKRVQNRLV